MEIKYNNIGSGYNATRQADPYLLSRLNFLLKPESNKLYLDIGCGTGNYTIALADKGLKFIGMDPSEKMLNEARSRNPNVDWIPASAEKIPVEDKIFDGVIATLTIHHWSNLKKGFAEISRVLADDGRFVIFTSTPEQMKGYWLNHYFAKMLHSSIVQMPSLNDIHLAAEEANLTISDVEKYYIKDDLQDCFLYVGKNKPGCYFDEHIRRGISSFSTLANQEEVSQGLSKLSMDMTSGDFETIKNHYKNDLGDYLFITMIKA